jgi:hypothetical protein
MPRRTASSKDHREPLIKGSSSLDGEEAGGEDGQGGAVGREGGAWEGGGMDYSDEGVGGQQRTEDVSWLRIVCINGVRLLSSTPDSSLFHLPQSYPWLHQESCVPYHSNEESGSSKLLARAANTKDMSAQPGFFMPTHCAPCHIIVACPPKRDEEWSPPHLPFSFLHLFLSLFNPILSLPTAHAFNYGLFYARWSSPPHLPCSYPIVW